jgi:GNAT superfamily N-acetyltransferase
MALEGMGIVLKSIWDVVDDLAAGRSLRPAALRIVAVVASSSAHIHVRTVGDEPQLAAALADLLIDCVDGGASVSFMWPLPRRKALDFWGRVIESARRGERTLLVAEDAAGEVQGSVQVVFDLPENQPHRCDVAKMLVHRRARRRGVGTALMVAAESAARAAGRTLLVLDTVTGADGERLYTRLGWQRAGIIPGYALWPRGGTCDTTFFYKVIPERSDPP